MKGWERDAGCRKFLLSKIWSDFSSFESSEGTAFYRIESILLKTLQLDEVIIAMPDIYF
jgi:hypothetical protein